MFTQKLRRRRGARLPLLFVLFLFCIGTGCGRYMAYKTTISNPQKAYEKMVRHWSPYREYVLSIKGKEYTVRNLTFDTLGIKAITSPKEKRLFYHPEDNAHAKSNRPVIKYKEFMDSASTMNQVFIVADSIEQNGDSLTIPMKAVRRIDVIKENHLMTFLLVITGVLLLIFIIGAILVEEAFHDASKDGCFIATACYGNYDSPEVRVLRHYRDQHLSKSAGGRLFIRVYYALSPALARRLARSESMKSIVRTYLIRPMVARLVASKKLNQV